MKWVSLILSALLFSAILLAQTTESKLATIRGTVLDAATSAPVPKGIVKLTPLNSYGDGQQTTTATADEKGAYEFKSVKPGQYRLGATKTGYLGGSYGRKPSGFGIPLGVSEGATLSGIDIKMERGGVISGRVLNEDGEPFPNVSISAMTYRRIQGKKRLLSAAHAQTDDRGEYRLHDLRPGSYYIQCNPQNRYGPNTAVTDAKHGYGPVLFPNATSTDGATPIKIANGSEEVAEFSVSPSAAFTVKGTVSGADGVVNVMAQRADDPFSFAGPQALAKDGAFELKSVLPGTYNVYARSFNGDKQRTTHQKLTVTDGDVSNINLNFEAGPPEIHGIIQILGTDKPDYSEMSVMLRSPINAPSDDDILPLASNHGQVNKEGAFTVSPSITDSRIMVEAYGRHFEGVYVKSVSFGTRDVTDSGFLPTGGASLRIVLSPNAASLEGQVLDKEGKPFSGAHVFTVPEESRRGRHDCYRSAPSDQRGYFEIRNVVPGNYKVIAVEDDEQTPPFDAEFLKAHLSDGQDLKAEERGKYNLKVTVIPSEPAK